MGFKYAAFLSYLANFPPHFLLIVVEVNALGLLHVLKLCLGVSKGMLPVEYFWCYKFSFCVS